MKKLLSILGTLTLALALTSCSDNQSSDNKVDETILNNSAYKDYLNSENPTVNIKIKDYGNISLQLFPEVAPISVDNFLTLAEDKFYDGLILHRIIKDFMIQGGDPSGDGTGGSPKNIIGEFSSNGIQNDLSHNRGVISMARSNDPNSASSQFFIVHQDSTFLDGNYAGFGGVTSGLDVVDSIASVETNSNDKPLNDVVIESITVDRKDFKISNDKFLSNDNPEVKMTFTNDLEIKFQLFPKEAKLQVDNFISLIENESYLDENASLSEVEGTALVIDSSKNEDYYIKSTENDIHLTKGTLAMYNQGILNSENSDIVIFKTLSSESFTPFAQIVEGLDDFINTTFTEEIKIKNIELDKKNYKPGEVNKVSNVFKPATEFLSDENTKAIIEFNNGEVITIELFDKLAPNFIEFFKTNSDDYNNKKLFQITNDENTKLVLSEGKENQIENLESESVFNGYENTASFDKYAVGAFFSSFNNTNGALMFSFGDNKVFNALYPVIGYVIDNTEFIDKLADVKQENQMITEDIHITKISFK